MQFCRIVFKTICCDSYYIWHNIVWIGRAWARDRRTAHTKKESSRMLIYIYNIVSSIRTFINSMWKRINSMCWVFWFNGTHTVTHIHIKRDRRAKCSQWWAMKREGIEQRGQWVREWVIENGSVFSKLCW